MKVRPFKIEMRYNGKVPDKIFFKRLGKAIDNGNVRQLVAVALVVRLVRAAIATRWCYQTVLLTLI